MARSGRRSLAGVLDHADEGKLTIGMGHIHAIPHDEHVRAGEAHIFGIDGHRALARLFEEDRGLHPAGAVELLLTDIRMPIMDGIALALAAKRDFPDLTILLMTGFADQRERARDLDAIVSDVLTKPFSLADLRLKVREAMAA